MKNKYLYTIIIIAVVCCIISCKDNETGNDNPATNAVLTWTGDYEVDGCGFFVTINDKKYKPENEEIIHDSFKQSDEAPVIIEYMILNKKIEKWCGDLSKPTSEDGIKIISLKKR